MTAAILRGAALVLLLAVATDINAAVIGIPGGPSVSLGAGGVSASFGGYSASAGLGGGAAGGGAGGGLFARAGTPGGPSAAAGLGGGSASGGAAGGGLFAGAGVGGGGPSAAAGLSGGAVGGGTNVHSRAGGGLFAGAGVGSGGPSAAAGLGGGAAGAGASGGGLYAGAGGSSSSSSSSAAAGGGGTVVAGNRPTIFDSIFNIPTSVLNAVNQMLNNKQGTVVAAGGVTQVQPVKTVTVVKTYRHRPPHIHKKVYGYVDIGSRAGTVAQHGAVVTTGQKPPGFYDNVFNIPISTLNSVNQFLNNLG